MPNSPYVSHRPHAPGPRLPRKGWIDITYRCNNNCRHCWQSLPADAPMRKKELSFDDLREIADQARRAGCGRWAISGGEPMLRPDFAELFDYLTRRAATYDLNTNGSLLTPALARLLVREGNKMVAVYGADAKVHDAITRAPGSFEACMRGVAYLREASAGFTVQLIPMRDNVHQREEMVRLARRLSPSYRFGASWLYLSAGRRPGKNREIIHQRLTPAEVVDIDPPRPVFEDYTGGRGPAAQNACASTNDARLLENCILNGRQFHIDPYGSMSICYFMKDPSLRFDLNTYSFDEIWRERLPSRGLNCPGQDEYARNCGSCEYRDACCWCPAHAWLERGRLSAPMPYLCEIAKEKRRYKREWIETHYQRFEIAGMTVHVDSDIPLKRDAFGKRFDPFRTDRVGDDHLYISHHFSLPDLGILNDAELVHDKLPWAIFRLDRSWIYLAQGHTRDYSRASCVAVFNNDHTRVRIYHKDESLIHRGNLASLTTFPTDQIMLARVLADREGCYLHSSGLVFNGKGVLFVGPSDAGKSTMVKMLRSHGRVLTDDRNIVRRWPDGHRVHGTWSHGEVPMVSNTRAPLEAILFIEQAGKTRITPLTDRKIILHELLNRVIKPFCTVDWWDKTIRILGDMAARVPFYQFRFTREKNDVLNAVRDITGPLKSVETDQPNWKRLEIET